MAQGRCEVAWRGWCAPRGLLLVLLASVVWTVSCLGDSNMLGSMDAERARRQVVHDSTATPPRAFWSSDETITEPLPSASQSQAQLLQEQRRQQQVNSAGELRYMMDIYKQRSYQVRESPDIVHHMKDEGKCQRPESTVIHSFPFIGVHNNCLHFAVTTPNPAQELCKGNLRLYYHSSGNKRRAGRRRAWWRFPLLVRLDVMGLYPNANKTVVVASQTHPIPGVESSGWFDVEISKAFSNPANMPLVDSQMFLEPRITLFGSDGEIKIATDPGESNRPLLVVYNHEDPAASDAALLAALQRVRQRQLQEQIVDENNTPVSEDINSNDVTSRRKRQANVFVEHCDLHYRRVPMSAIGFPYVIQPPYFPMTFCEGSCQHPIVHPTRSSLHGRLMAMLHTMGGRRRPRAKEPCCAPSGMLAGLDMLYVWPSGGFTIKYHSNMVVESCGCD
ncbi:bone morphogenetic protein 10-like [Sycon ciliatum]|uniref:bone morphogenetic protein 10-like n=1 Tax=Sycon ciliatum TaxID=27933 RepID=UPI0031F5F5B5